MHKKILLGTGIVLVGIITFIVGLIMVNNNPDNALTWMGLVGAIFVSLSPVSILTVLMMIFDVNSDQKRESK